MSSRSREKGKARLSVPMDRSRHSASSARSSPGSTISGTSEWPNPDDNDMLSPRSPFSCMNDSSPINAVDDFNTPRVMVPGQQQPTPSYGNAHPLLPFAVEPLPEVPDTGLPPFNIEQSGDPRISWYMYYRFTVTKSDAYWKLRPGYVPSAKYPSIKPVEKTKKQVYTLPSTAVHSTKLYQKVGQTLPSLRSNRLFIQTFQSSL